MIVRQRRDLSGGDSLTTCADFLLQRLKRGVRPIGDAFFDQRPEPLGRIQLRRVGWQANQRQAFGHPQGFGAMCRCAIQDQHNAFLRGGVRAGELVEKQLHHLGIQVGQHEPEDAPRLRMH